MLVKMNSLAGVPVKVSPHRTLNCTKGFIRCKDLASLTKEEIIDGLRDQGVTDVVIVTVKDGSERRRTNTIVLSFCVPQLPSQDSFAFPSLHTFQIHSDAFSAKSMDTGNPPAKADLCAYVVANRNMTALCVRTQNTA